MTTTFAALEVTKDEGQVATAQEPNVDVEDKDVDVVVPPMRTPPVVVEVEFEAMRIWPLAESRLVLFRITSP